jgi:peptidoglycan-associated lipoprotein
MRYRTLLITLAGAAMAAACHPSPPPEPTPVPTPEVAMQNVFNQDSADAARSAEAAAWAHEMALAEQAYADSVAAARVAFEAANNSGAALAAAKSAELRSEMGVMVHFDVGQAQLQDDARNALDRKVAILAANPAVRLKITGACDERGSNQYNAALGERRAAAVSRYLVGKGVDVARLDRISTGETAPIDTGDTEAAWAQNRRAEFAIVSGDVVLAMNQ